MEYSSEPLRGGGGRFSCGMDVNLAQLNNSLSIEKRLYVEDILSLTHADILPDAKIIQPDELEMMESLLELKSLKLNMILRRLH